MRHASEIGSPWRDLPTFPRASLDDIPGLSHLQLQQLKLRLTTPSMASTFTKETWKIPSATPGWNLDAWCYLPIRRGPSPVIVMAHGFSANKLMSLSGYAEAFSTLGYGVVVFDYRRWGASDGHPKRLLVVAEQLEDYRTVVKYCRQRSEFDSQRIILWGISFSGGHVVTLASEPELNICATITTCPYLGTNPVSALHSSFLWMMLYAIADALKQALGFSPIYMPACALPGQLGGMTTPSSLRGMLKIVEKPSDYVNEVSASSVFQLPFYKPDACMPRISTPLLVIVFERDDIVPLQQTVDVARATPVAELVRFDGGHFDGFQGMPLYDAALNTMVAFLRKHVPL